jgi:predicted CXXCH cytochrome family protein
MRAVIAAVGFLTLLFLAMVESRAMVDVLTLENESFAPKKRPPVVFAHDAHNEAAGIEDCAGCHHLYENGAIIQGMDSAGIPCSDCHSVRPAENRVPLMVGYHTLCRGCHLDKKAGPVTCAQCHRRSSFF